MKNTIYIFSFFLLLCACNNHQEFDNRDIINLFVDSTPVQKNLSEVVDSIRIIPLEISDSSLIGIVNKLSYDDNYFFIQDRNSYLVNVYDTKGGFKRTVAQIGDGPKEIQNPDFFVIDKIHKEVWISNVRSFLRFNYQGNYLGRRNYAMGFDDCYIDQNYDIYFYTGKNDNAHIQDSFLTGDLTLLTTNDKKRTWFKSDLVSYYPVGVGRLTYPASHPFSSQEDGSITFSYTFNDTIYSIKEQRIMPKYRVHFDKGVDASKLNNMPGEEIEKFIKSRPLAHWNMNNVFETPTYLTFNYLKNLDYSCWVIYNKRTQTLSNFRLKDDLFNQEWIRIEDTDNDKFIFYIPAEKFKISKKVIPFIGEKKFEQLKRITPDDNPIIIVFTLKDGL